MARAAFSCLRPIHLGFSLPRNRESSLIQIEFVHITGDTTPEKLEEELLVKDLIWKLR